MQPWALWDEVEAETVELRLRSLRGMQGHVESHRL